MKIEIPSVELEVEIPLPDGRKDSFKLDVIACHMLLDGLKNSGSDKPTPPDPDEIAPAWIRTFGHWIEVNYGKTLTVSQLSFLAVANETAFEEHKKKFDLALMSLASSESTPAPSANGIPISSTENSPDSVPSGNLNNVE